MPVVTHTLLATSWEAQAFAHGATQFRRPVKPQCGSHTVRCPFGVPGDVVLVKETWGYWGCDDQGNPRFAYRADGERPGIKWKCSSIMPPVAVRTRRVMTEVRVERAQAITEEDARACGVPLQRDNADPTNVAIYPPRVEFRNLWDSRWSKKGYPWSGEAFCWVVNVRSELPDCDAGKGGE